MVLKIMEGGLTEKQVQLLRLLFKKSSSMKVFTVYETQRKLARELGITRQALNIHLRKLRDEGYIRTGRGFIDLTEKAARALGLKTSDVFVAIKVSPRMRVRAYRKIRDMPVEQVYRITGGIDLLVQLNQAILDQFLNNLSQIEGIEETTTYVVIETLK